MRLESGIHHFFQNVAAAAFGNFQESFLDELYDDIISHLNRQQHALNTSTQGTARTVAGVTVYDSEILAPDPDRRGGLIRSENGKQHVFKAPSRPNGAAPTSSLLGLDKLAIEKRAAANSQSDDTRKRKRDDLDGPAKFKGFIYASTRLSARSPSNSSWPSDE